MKHYTFIFTTAVVALVLAGCQVDKKDYTSFVKDAAGYHVISDGDVDLDNQFPVWADQIGNIPSDVDPCDPNGYNQVEGKSTFMQMFSPLMNMITYASVHQIVGTYQSEYKGNPIMLSGNIYVPKSKKCRGLIMACHYTYAALSESPSQGPTLSALLATKGYAVVDADLVGFGVTYQLVHPYLDKLATGRAIADFGRIARPFLEANGYTFETDNIYLFGYSQGGHGAVATQEFIESHPDYHNDLPLTKVFCGGGPYDPMVTYDVAKKTDVIGFPAVVPMFLQGTIYANDLNDPSLAMPITESDFLSDEMLKEDRYKTWLNSKAYTMDQVNLLMKGIGCGEFSTILRPEAMEESYPQNVILFKKLEENATTDFCPKTPMYIFHSKGDDVVTFENAEILQNRFRELGADESKIEYDFGNYGSHRSGLLKFHMKVLKMLN
jgi:alpha-beta hydrolase superfamily lysophospholipase